MSNALIGAEVDYTGRGGCAGFTSKYVRDSPFLVTMGNMCGWGLFRQWCVEPLVL